MKTVGQVLHETRVAKKVSLEEIEEAIRIKKKHLLALEKDDFTNLPPSPYIKGFIKNYGEYLELDSARLLALFRRDFDETKNGRIVPKGMVEPLDHPRVVLTPPKVLGGIIILVLILFGLYLWRGFFAPPPLEVESPSDNLVVNEGVVEVSGSTDPEAVLTINGQEVQLKEAGRFGVTINLNEKVNTITVVATNKLGRKAVVKRTVRVSSPQSP